MKQNNGGFSLVEIVAAIAILGMFFAAACSSLVLGLRMNQKTNVMLQNQLEVSSAVETLMAEGISPAKGSFEIIAYDEFGEVTTTPDLVKNQVESGLYDDYVTQNDNGESVTVDNFPKVTVTTEREKSADETDFLPYYKVTVTSEIDSDITVTTYIREVAE